MGLIKKRENICPRLESGNLEANPNNFSGFIGRRDYAMSLREWVFAYCI
jgi:hypothetical protein